MAAVLRTVLQNQLKHSETDHYQERPSILLVAMPAAQHISADDFASLLKVPLLKADRNCTLMLCEQTAAQALEAEHIYELLDSLLQHRVVDSTHNPWLPGADVLLGLPGAQELSAGQIKDLLQHVSFGLLDR